MTTAKVIELTQIAADELRKEKICLIEDIFKVKRTCFGFNVPGHSDVIHNPTKLFDSLYDMKIEDLEVELAMLSAIMSRRARVLAGYQIDLDSE